MAVVIAARRSAVVPRGGAFAHLAIEELAAPVVRACLADCGLDRVDELICANAIGPGGNPARRIALAAGLPEQVAGLTIDRQCAGGLDALLLAKALVDSGAAKVVLAGGVESYSRRPLRLITHADGSPPTPYDEAPFTPWPDRNPSMSVAAAELARRLGISRAEQDHWAVDSHAKALAAGALPEIVAISGISSDQFPRALTLRTTERAAVVAGTITSANAAVAADAAAFCIVAQDHLAPEGALKITAGTTLGDDPEQPGLAPVPAIANVLSVTGLTPSKLAQVELMEAYAVQAIACVRNAGLPAAIVNPKGGGLARGHPIGASGAILAVRLFHDLVQGHGLAAIASAGGLGTAVLFERSGA